MTDEEVVEASAGLVQDLTVVAEFRDVAAAREIIETGLRKFVGLEKEHSQDRIWKHQRFEEWWEIYQKKVKKTPTYLKWMRLRRHEIETILATTPAFIRAKPDPKYRPDPLTYVNQKRWEDDLGESEVKMVYDGIKNTFTYD